MSELIILREKRDEAYRRYLEAQEVLHAAAEEASQDHKGPPLGESRKRDACWTKYLAAKAIYEAAKGDGDE